ncbi:MAG: isoprenylcysteine carboxylmethyltransferase family protein [archaeon]|nr:isoprenylcysteine carboxylmethyltransferase family protein [archaeon]MCP8316260.1 isoprenylcysteine carboxylmethyltransferase family protein [archaeon]
MIELLTTDLVGKFVKWSREKRSKAQRLWAIFFGVIIFVLFLPLILILGGYTLDSWLGFSKALPEPANLVIGLSFITIGWSVALWSVYVQYRIGKGTPFPIVPTQKLVISGPYKYCRNPMALGTIIFYTGLAILLNTTSMLIILTPIVFIPILVFVKLVEEKELERRFGQEYLEYKKKTPFLIPKIL